MIIIAARSEVTALRCSVCTLVVGSLGCFFLNVFIGLKYVDDVAGGNDSTVALCPDCGHVIVASG